MIKTRCTKNRPAATMPVIRGWLLPAAILCALSVIGCQSNQQSLWAQIKQLGEDKTDLKIQAEHLQQENALLKQQVQTLASTDKQIRLEAILIIDKIEIIGSSGFDDKDGDGKKETLVLYIRPYDDTGDTVKIAGQLNIQIWDLSEQSDKALAAERTIEPEQLKHLWAGTFMTYYYRVVFDAEQLPAGNEKELTVKATFTDYLSGRVVSDQVVIRP